MDFLKAVLGDRYEEFVNLIKGYNEKPENKDKQVKLIDLNKGEYVSKAKYDEADTARKTLRSQLDEAEETLKGFEGVDVKDLQTKVSEFSTQLETQKTDYENQIAQMKFNAILDGAITASGGKNAKAIKALLDVESLMNSKDQTTDIQAAVNACKEENAYMFGDDEPINNPVGQTGGQTVTPPGKNPEDMSYEEYRAWREGK